MQTDSFVKHLGALSNGIRRWLARPAKLAVLGLCKLVVLLAVVPFSGDSEGKSVESESTESVEAKCESLWLSERRSTRKLVVATQSRCTRLVHVTQHFLVTTDQNVYVPQADGHRLHNGLLAPLCC